MIPVSVAYAIEVKTSDKRFTKTGNLVCGDLEIDVPHREVLGFDLGEAIESLPEEDRQAEADLLQNIFEFAKEISPYDFGEFLENAEQVFADSKLLAGHPAAQDFLNKYRQSAKVTAKLDAHDNDRQALQNAMDQARQELRDIWGSEIKIIGTSRKKLADQFKAFTDIIHQLDTAAPPVPMDSPVSYQVRMNRQGFPDDTLARTLKRAFGGAEKMQGDAPYWDLATRFFRIQDQYGFLPPDVPAYRIVIDRKQDGIPQQRITATGNSFDELAETIADKAKTSFGTLENIGDQTRYQAVIHNYGAHDKPPLYIPGPDHARLEDLFNDLPELKKYMPEAHGHFPAPMI